MSDAFGGTPVDGALNRAVLNTVTIPAGKTFYVNHRRASGPIAMRTYHYNLAHYELILLTEGTCRCFMGSEMYMLRGGDESAMMAIMDKGVSHHHSFDRQTHHSLYHVFFNDGYLAHFKDRTGEDLLGSIDVTKAVRLEGEALLWLTRLLDRIIKEDEPAEMDSMTSAVREMLIDLFFVHLCRLDKEIVPVSVHDHIHPTVLRIIRYIDEHYAQSLSLSSMAAGFSLNKYYLCRLFRADTNLTVTGYIIRVRVKHACRLLQRGKDSITDIAYAVGYGNTTYFSRVFKEMTGRTPSEYRRDTAGKGE